jgi:hypothetical protein
VFSRKPEMKAICVFVAITFSLAYFGILLGSAVASSLCEHEWCRFQITGLCAVFFAMIGGFLVSCVIAPHSAPEICHACCSLTTDCASDIACALVIDQCVS